MTDPLSTSHLGCTIDTTYVSMYSRYFGIRIHVSVSVVQLSHPGSCQAFVRQLHAYVLTDPFPISIFSTIVF